MGSIEERRKLFSPLKIGDMQLSHRIIMSPLTRARCPGGLPTQMVADYYAQRATKGGLIISEGMHPSTMAGNFLNVPSMYSKEHIEAWKVVIDAVHAKGGYMVCQLWHVGRFGVAINMGGRQPLSSSTTNIGGTNPFTVNGRVPTETAKEMSLEDIALTIDDHVHAAKYAIEAGFDAVEITSANGYLLDQFINDKINLRTDRYGGTEENRCRFSLEVLDAVSGAIGASKTAVRFSPFGTVLIPVHSDPISTFSYMLSEVEKRGLAYVCLTQPRTDLILSESVKWENLHQASKNGTLAVMPDEMHLRYFAAILRNTPKLATGGYDNENCFEEVENGELDAITFGRWFISNPDLVEKIRLRQKLSPLRRETLYTPGPEGYVDYPVGEIL